jgi:hypothetical protein
VDLGAPIAYLVLEKGVPVFDPAGREVGKVEHVLAAVDEDIFDGIVIDTRAGPGGWRFADAPQVEGIYERGVGLAVGLEALHEPSENPAVLKVDPAEAEEGVADALERKLRRAWDYITGNY